MDPTKIEWNKKSPGEVQFFSNNQRSIQKLKSQKKKCNKKTVQFNCPPPSVREQAFEGTEYNQSGTVSSHKTTFENHDLASSSTDTFVTDSIKVNREPVCSVRATVVTFIIVILIILAAAIPLGIVFGTINSQQNSSATTITNNNQNTLSTISTTVVTSSVSIGSQNGTPCTSYTTINDPSRNVAQTGLYGTCDKGPLFNASNGGSWIRFIGSGGTIIPLTSPGSFKCGGYLPIWFNGSLPVTIGIVVNGQLCFDFDPYPCQLTMTISVVNCSGFFIYLLPPVSICNARYCTT